MRNPEAWQGLAGGLGALWIQADDLSGWLALVAAAGLISTAALIATIAVLWRRRGLEVAALREGLRLTDRDLAVVAAAVERLTTAQPNTEARLSALELAMKNQSGQLAAIADGMRQLADRAYMEDLFARRFGWGGAPQQSVTIASGERSAAVGRDATRSPVTTGNENETKQGE